VGLVAGQNLSIGGVVTGEVVKTEVISLMIVRYSL